MSERETQQERGLLGRIRPGPDNEIRSIPTPWLGLRVGSYLLAGGASAVAAPQFSGMWWVALEALAFALFVMSFPGVVELVARSVEVSRHV